MNTLAALKRSPLGLDFYLWLNYRNFALCAPLRLSWRALYRQFGADPAKANDKLIVNAFRTDSLRELKKIKIAWPELNYTTAQGRIDPVALEARDCTHDRPTAPRGVAPGSPRSDRTRAGCFRWRRDDVPWQSRKPHIRKDDQNPANSVGGLRRTLCGLFVPREQLDNANASCQKMPPVPQEGPLTQSRSDEPRARGHLFSYQPPQSGLERF